MARLSFLLRLSAASTLLIPAVGCHSAYIEATVRNESDTTIPLVEVDYPSASFGSQQLAPHAEFHYRFKILGSGSTKVLWTDAAHHDHTVTGPVLHEGEQGRMTVALTGTSANWDLVLHPR